MAFSPKHVPYFDRKILSIYTSNIPLTAGALVDIDATDTSLIAGTLGGSSLSGGTLKLATVATQSTTVFGKELGVVIVNVNATGPSLVERLLGLASSYMTIPEGVGVPVYVPASGDIIASDQYVGALSADTGATGLINTALQANLGAPCGIFQGRFRLAQSGDAVRARFMGNTQLNGASVALFQFA